MARQFARVVEFMGGCHEVFFFGEEDIGNELLWVAIDKGKPGALYLNHDSMARFEGVHDIANAKTNSSRLARLHGHWPFKALAEATSQDASPNQFLSAAEHGLASRFVVFGAVDRGPRELVDHLHDPVGVGA